MSRICLVILFQDLFGCKKETLKKKNMAFFVKEAVDLRKKIEEKQMALINKKVLI